jgi:hypothetical protein
MNSATSIDELNRQLAERLGADRVFRPGDGAYASATALWNTGVTARPALVVRPRTSAEVASAVTAARGSGFGVSVRGGGHDWAGRALRDGGLVWSGDPELADAAIGDVMRLGTAIMSTAGATSQKDLLDQFDQHTPPGGTGTYGPATSRR